MEDAKMKEINKVGLTYKKKTLPFLNLVDVIKSVGRKINSVLVKFKKNIENTIFQSTSRSKHRSNRRDNL